MINKEEQHKILNLNRDIFPSKESCGSKVYYIVN